MISWLSMVLCLLSHGSFSFASAMTSKNLLSVVTMMAILLGDVCNVLLVLDLEQKLHFGFAEEGFFDKPKYSYKHILVMSYTCFDHNIDFENIVILTSESRVHHRQTQESLYIKTMDCSDDLKVMTNLEQGKQFHESWDPYLPMTIRDVVFEKLGREEREPFKIESEQESSSEDE